MVRLVNVSRSARPSLTGNEHCAMDRYRCRGIKVTRRGAQIVSMPPDLTRRWCRKPVQSGARKIAHSRRSPLETELPHSVIRRPQSG